MSTQKEPLEPIGPGITQQTVKTVEVIAAHSQEMVDYWTKKKEIAVAELEYWTRQRDAACIVSTRLVLQKPQDRER